LCCWADEQIIFDSFLVGRWAKDEPFEHATSPGEIGEEVKDDAEALFPVGYIDRQEDVATMQRRGALTSTV